MGLADDIRRQVEEGADEGLMDFARELLRRAEANAPPSPPPDEDPNEAVSLKDAGRIEVDPGGKSVTVGFYTRYAAKLHEAKHYEHPRGGKAKYLEDELKAMAPQLERFVAGPITARMRNQKTVRRQVT